MEAVGEKGCGDAEKSCGDAVDNKPDTTAPKPRNKFSVSKVASPTPAAEDTANHKQTVGDSPPITEVVKGSHDEVSQEENSWQDPKKAAFLLGQDLQDNSQHGDEADKQKGAKEFKVTKVDFDLGPQEKVMDADDRAVPQSPTNSYVTQSYDTHNLKTFGQDTLETLPNMDHYRNLLSATGAMRKRPTLAELHDLEANRCAHLLQQRQCSVL